MFDASPAREGLAAEYRTELEQQLPESHPSRALYGEYLGWFYDRAVAQLPERVRLVRHYDTAVGIEREGVGADARERIALASGAEVLADAVILATGWMPRTPTPFEVSLHKELGRRPELAWVPPASPVDQDLSRIEPGSHAIVRGLGMGFFDTMALLTIGRGGVFVPDADAPHGLRYEPSGREPVLHVTSHRGVPFRAKTLYHSLPPMPQQRHARAVDWASEPRPIDFNRALWPRIVADAYVDYVDTLHRTRPEAIDGSLAQVHGAIEETLDEVLAERSDDLELAARRIAEAVNAFVPDAADRLDLLGEMRPVRRDFASPREFDVWVAERTAEDLRQATLGHDSAVKAGLWSISAARGLAGHIGTLGGFDAESRATGFAMLMAVGGMAGSGPPAFRNQQLLALVDAGLVHFIGPAAGVGLASEGFTAESPQVGGSRVVAPALIDAWMHFHSLDDTADPLALSLRDAGRARPFRVSSRGGERLATGSFDIDFATGRLIGAAGTIDPAVHVAGIPVDEQLHGTIISPMPGTDPPMLRETDRIARSAIEIATATAAESTGGSRS